jgi:tRNA-binding EMAP/Myf-like protein
VSTVDFDALTRERTTAPTVRVVVTAGAIAGQVIKVDDHPRAQKIWLAWVDIGGDAPVQIVFGGNHLIQPDNLVPVAPPGARVVVHRDEAKPKKKKMRSRQYRGERSHGMLCSLDELGWAYRGPDEVATLRDVVPGDSLDNLTVEQRQRKVDRHREMLVAPLAIMPQPCRAQIGATDGQLVTR